MSVRIELDEKALETAHNLFANAREQVGRAAGVAINRTLVTLRKEASITIREHYVIKAGKVKSSFTLHRAGRSSTRGSLVSKGNVLDLGNFRIAVGSAGSATPEEFTATMLRKPKVVFHPGKRLQEMRDVAKFARFTVDKDEGADAGGA